MEICQVFNSENRAIIKGFIPHFTLCHHDIILSIVTKKTSKGEMPKIHDKQNIDTKIWIVTKSQ